MWDVVVFIRFVICEVSCLCVVVVFMSRHADVECMCQVCSQLQLCVVLCLVTDLYVN